MLKWKNVVVALAALVVLVAGCDSTENTTTTDAVTSAEDVIFSEGELPDTIPADFPMPAGSAVGATMVVTKTGFTEVVLRVNAEQGIAVEFFNQALSQAGFTVDRSEADASGWLIEFSRDGEKGTIGVSAAQESISQAIIRYNVP